MKKLKRIDNWFQKDRKNSDAFIDTSLELGDEFWDKARPALEVFTERYGKEKAERLLGKIKK